MTSGEILNIKDVANYLKIPVSTIYKLIQEGKIPAVKLGKHWRFMKKDIDLLFLHPRPEPSGEILDERPERPERKGTVLFGTGLEKED